MSHVSIGWKIGLVLGASLIGGACADRSHMRPSHGRAVSHAIAAQTANPEAGKTKRDLPPFDAQEASIVAGRYRDSLAGKGAGPQDDKGMLILAPPSSNQPYVPPPSVPERK